MSPYGKPRPANGDSSKKSSSSRSRRTRSLTNTFLFFWVCLMMALSPPPFFTFSLNSTNLLKWGHELRNGTGVIYIILKTDGLTYFLEQTLLFRRLASYTFCWMGKKGCRSTGKALGRARRLLTGKLKQRTEWCRGCSASLQHNVNNTNITQKHNWEAENVKNVFNEMFHLMTRSDEKWLSS